MFLFQILAKKDQCEHNVCSHKLILSLVLFLFLRPFNMNRLFSQNSCLFYAVIPLFGC